MPKPASETAADTTAETAANPAPETAASTAPEITVSAVVLRGRNGSVLHVRKQHTTMFMLPGGKPEPAESPFDCAIREVREELGLELDPARLKSFGTVKTIAANEANTALIAHVFVYADPVTGEAAPQAEIAELEFVSLADPQTQHRKNLAPLSQQHVLPALAATA